MSLKPKTAYRTTQAIAKSLGLPGNLKHSVLETLINARHSGDENIISEILRQTKEERDKRKKEKAEIRQTNYNLRMDTQQRSNNCLEIVPLSTPAKRPLGRPRKNKILDPQPERYHLQQHQMQHQSLIEHQRVSQLDQEALLQSRNVTELVKLYDSTYKGNKYDLSNNNNNNNNNSKTECQQRNCRKQMRSRNADPLYHPQNHRTAPRTTSCFSATVNPSHSVYSNFPFNNIYGSQPETQKAGYAFEKKIYRQMVQGDDCGASLIPNSQFTARYPTTTAHHYPQPNSYKSNRSNPSAQRSNTPYPAIQQSPIEYSYVPSSGYFPPQRTHNYFPSTPGPSSIQEAPSAYRNRPASVQNYVDPYVRPLTNESFNLRYGVNNQAQMVVSTTPLSDSTISANEMEDSGHYDNITPTLFNRSDLDTLIATATTSQVSLDSNNINYLTSCSPAVSIGTGAPSCSAITLANNGSLLSSSSATTSNQALYYPSFPFEPSQTVQNMQDSTLKPDMVSGNDVTYVYADSNNHSYKREIFEEEAATIEQITDQLAAVENCNDLMSATGSSSLLATASNSTAGIVSNGTDTLQDLQQELSQFYMLSVVDHQQWMYSEYSNYVQTHSFILN